MFSIQQLIKILRQFQSTEIVKMLTQNAAKATAATPTTTPQNSQSLADMISLLSTVQSTQSTMSSSTLPKQQQPEHEHKYVQQQHIQSSQQTNTTVSSISESRADGCVNSTLKSSTSTIVATTTTQDSNTKTYNSNHNNAFGKLNNSTTSVHLQSNQSSSGVQNSYQQQFHHFHTQQNQNLCAKQNQKQIQFAMSSLAAEALAVNQEEFNADVQHAIANGTDSHSTITSNITKEQQDQKSVEPSSPENLCFKNGLPGMIKFMELIGNLKHTKRTGWVLRDVSDCESISGHMYRMSILTFLLDGSEGLNQIRCMELALVHDLAESLVGDITPFCGISKDDKRSMEFKAMEDICKLIEPRGKRIMELFEEYEHGVSAESKFVKDLDRLDMVMQAFEYEKRDNCLLKHQEFFDSTEGKFNHPFVKKLVNEIYEQRDTLAKAKGAIAPPTIHVPIMELTANGKTLANGHQSSAADAASTTLTNGHENSAVGVNGTNAAATTTS